MLVLATQWERGRVLPLTDGLKPGSTKLLCWVSLKNQNSKLVAA